MGYVNDKGEREGRRGRGRKGRVRKMSEKEG